MADEAARLMWPDGTENAPEKMAMPGDNVEMVCELHAPHVIEPGQRFNMREGGRYAAPASCSFANACSTVATGLVTRVF